MRPDDAGQPKHDGIVCYLGLGSNLGDRAAQLAEALRRLDRHPQLQVLKASSVYETDPVGPQDQPDFLNLVAQLAVHCTPEELLQMVQRVEQQMGRVRQRRWGQRNIDIDILLFGDQTIDTPELQVPHPALKERQFVLVPLAEITPDLILPDGRRAVQAAHADDPTVRRIKPPVRR